MASSSGAGTNVSASSNTDDIKAELSKLLDEWSQHRREDDYNPTPFLTKYVFNSLTAPHYILPFTCLLYVNNKFMQKYCLRLCFIMK